MVVITVDNANERLRGECTRYLLEVKAGVFVGTISATVRYLLWESIVSSEDAGGAVLIYSAPTEQGFIMRMHGSPRRSIIDIDGLLLIKVQ